ncbi:predicted protein [Uncinocarpus reesii 1704]|uniref:Uncharacterized protein n=1 Tax=Uncinocarpus reesii (strain UAMH 1704) TaxID=336963 RepID=C4JMX6_UNCRE|nr:uncharacterized protein UREG_04184 [Uncinocarpus reesii 1704]EEP79338.1 predicted protein [Uncinocarpus reesii 1704]
MTSGDVEYPFVDAAGNKITKGRKYKIATPDGFRIGLGYLDGMPGQILGVGPAACGLCFYVKCDEWKKGDIVKLYYTNGVTEFVWTMVPQRDYLQNYIMLDYEGMDHQDITALQVGRSLWLSMNNLALQGKTICKEPNIMPINCRSTYGPNTDELYSFECTFVPVPRP